MSHLKQLQQSVDTQIQSFGGYFNEMTNLAMLAEETGEVARLINRVYGEQSFKKGKEPADPKSAIADELMDVLYIVTCLCNQMDIDMGKEMELNIDKKYGRDTQRHQSNPNLNSSI